MVELALLLPILLVTAGGLILGLAMLSAKP